MLAAAEQAATALTMNYPSRPDIYTDRRSAIQAFLSGLTSSEAAAIIKQRPPDTFYAIA